MRVVVAQGDGADAGGIELRPGRVDGLDLILDQVHLDLPGLALGGDLTGGDTLQAQLQGRVEIGDLSPEDVVPGDAVIIPPLVRQRISNTGTDELVFLCVCSPRFLPEAYEDLGEERAQ